MSAFDFDLKKVYLTNYWLFWTKAVCRVKSRISRSCKRSLRSEF